MSVPEQSPNADGHAGGDWTDPHSIQSPSVRLVAGKAASKVPRPRHRFPVGNKLGGRRPRPAPERSIDVLGSIVLDTLERLRRREYVVEELPNGTCRRREKPLEATTANAVANLVRVALDVEAQGAGERLRELTAELEELRGIVEAMIAARN